MADGRQQQQRIIRCNSSTVPAESGDLVIGDRNIITGTGFTVRGNGNRIRDQHMFAQLLANPVTHLTVQGHGNNITANQATVTGDENEIHGSYARATGDQNDIEGRRPEVRGHDNRVSGDYAIVTGDRNIVEGRRTEVRGHDNRVSGDYARVTGDRNIVEGRRTEVRGDNNAVSGEYSSAMGRNNTVNGFPAEEADQRRRESREQRLQHLQAAQENNQLNFQETMELNSLNALVQTDRHMQLLRQQLFQVNGQPVVQQARAQQRQPLRPRQAAPAPPQQQPQSIRLTLRGEDEAPTDENDTECLICRENKAVVLSTCCAKLTSCIACARTLYEGKMVGQVRCMNCREEVEHVMRILH